LNCAL